MSEMIVPRKTYFLVFAALMVLLVITAGAAEIDLGPFNIVVALTIAFCKAALVVLFFMEVKYSGRLIWILAISGFFWLAILIVLTLSDVLNRVPVLLPTH
jgi:cytochrome c oxidase subunit IV